MILAAALHSLFLQACTEYNVETLPEEPTTVVSTDVSEFEVNSTKTRLRACVKYTGEGGTNQTYLTPNFIF